MWSKRPPSHSMNFDAMNKAILKTEVQEFIRSFDEALSTLAFKGSPFPDISTQELLEQIDGFRRTEKKIPLWHTTAGIYYPKKINLEQASSEMTAAYKAKLVRGESMADLTGGFGIDVYYFAKCFQHVSYFEVQPELFEIARHNLNVLGAHNIACHLVDGLKALGDQKFDVLYMDPARRHDRKGKVFFLEDTTPNVVTNLSWIMKHCERFLLKTSPMLDIAKGLESLTKVKEVHVVALQNEVKEVLWVLDNESHKTVQIHTVNLESEYDQHYSFRWNSPAQNAYSDPLNYLYEPNAAIMKAGGFNQICSDFPVFKLGASAHLFTSETCIEFPGRRFRIKEVRPYKKGALSDFKNKQAHITTRGFPETVAQLRKKWHIKDGGETYLFFTTLENSDKVVLITDKNL